MKPKILLIEDNKDHQKIISRHLGGYAVEITSRGSSGLEALLKAEFELIVVDYNLGDMNGIDFVKLVRGQNILTPILMISSQDSIELEIKAVHSGTNFFISKERLWKNHRVLSEAVSAIIREAGKQTSQKMAESDDSNLSQNTRELTAGDWIRLFRNIRQSLVILNQNEEIVLWNEKAIEMFGLPQFRGQTLPMDSLMSIENIRVIRKKMSSASGGKNNVKDSSGESVIEFREDNLELRILSIKDHYGSIYTLFIGTYLIENKAKLAEMSNMLAV